MMPGLTVISSYTYSKSLDNASAIRGQGDTIFPQNSRCLMCDYGRSAFDIRHRWISSILYDLPFGPGRAFLTVGGGESNRRRPAGKLYLYPPERLAGISNTWSRPIEHRKWERA